MPIPDTELVEILKKNVRPEVRKVLLHFDIKSTTSLREFVLRHEILEKELIRSKFLASNIRHAFETVEDQEIVDDKVEEDKILTCWNCSQHAHCLKDCLTDRRTFFYGCKSPQTLKPNCSKYRKTPKNSNGTPLNHQRSLRTHQ